MVFHFDPHPYEDWTRGIPKSSPKVKIGDLGLARGIDSDEAAVVGTLLGTGLGDRRDRDG